MKKLIVLFFITGILTARAQHFTLIKDINPGAATSNICYLTNVNGKLFFAANNGAQGMELWKSDGTAGGTVLVKDIYAGSPSSSIGYLINANGTLFFVANDGTTGAELWKSDGTAAGTVMVKDINPGSMGSNPYSLININGIIYFAADNGTHGVELWKSDGTSAGTVMVKDINPSSASSNVQSLANLNGVLFFAADNGVKGVELWTSNGTAAGTNIFKDIYTGAADSYPYELTVVGNNLFFAATQTGAGTELWKSDGTAAGTTLLKDVWSGNNDAYPFGLVNVNGTLFFSADNGANGIELWKSDGTSAGTSLVKDVWPGQESGAVGNFSRFINKLIFTGNDGINGYRTWQSDGSATGTKMATGLADPGDGDMGEILETGTKIYAGLRYDETGSELWAVNFSVVLPLDLMEFSGMLAGNDTQLNWKTANELNSASFIIERSVDGRDYEAVGKLSATNNSGIQSYRFVDAGAKLSTAKTLYYRLKLLDIDSRYSYSKVITIELDKNNNISIYPNPAINDLRVVTGSSINGTLQYRIIDNAGRTVLQQTRKTSGGDQMKIDISQLSAGVYHLDVRGATDGKVLRFIKK